MEWHISDFEKRTSISCEMKLPQVELELNQDLAIAIFRIFQEALTNVARHANASQVKVSLKERENVVKLTVQDNGIGIDGNDIADSRSLGLIGMRERALYWGGKVKVSSGRGKGTTVTLTIPLERKHGG